ncbi:DUF3219 family protein [Bacillus mesophilum]|uniref:DUF3219 family protein n=1 Tax=Bacillus mesophilum TaxID=1071718 RepID=A0A7V7RKX8_9BACI|nr:DUF3219 family protein [Bacillus mesophilum]KAB2331983.1 DUF3219 family protein [Bacillus mesophilum]
MNNEIRLNGTSIKVKSLNHDVAGGLHKITVVFNVNSEEYHDIAVLLYEKSFQVSVPSLQLAFTGEIVHYYTSLTNLYEKGNVGEYTVTFLEKEQETQ